jgi:hypothetical protein
LEKNKLKQKLLLIFEFPEVELMKNIAIKQKIENMQGFVKIRLILIFQ